MEESKRKFIVNEALSYFLKYGVKSFTMDDIAEKLCVSKKTLYALFTNKETLLFETVDELWKNFLVEVQVINEVEELNPLQKIIKIYTFSIRTIKSIDPVFIQSLQKYQNKVMKSFLSNREHFSKGIIKPLLIEAQEKGFIEANLDIDFFIEVNFENVDKRIWYEKIISQHSETEIVNYLITYRLKGIATNPNLVLLTTF
ncbi:TetR/AcrR family transcriptional regulator [Flavobacterium haoranii]|uniref:Transcriptional regulator, TetR family n=1 Tax=Flavobacterium haoranii TaxID=683124 RepID=A0A1M6E807_9FLAO|nr:TetR/AcrR family transcriptional regulator [Flavobacterium haoranii]SHI81428.1 transcriptional regulator, TetR family [Flavobacterium haoranii]